MAESFPAPNAKPPTSDSAATPNPSPNDEPKTPPATFAATMTPTSPQQPEPLASRPEPLTKKAGGFVRPGQGVEVKTVEEKGKVGGGALRRLREGVRKVMMRSGGGGKGKEGSEGKKKGGDWMGAGGD